METNGAANIAAAEPSTVQEGELALPDDQLPTESLPRVDELGPQPTVQTPEEEYEKGLIREFDQAFKKWLAKRGWTKGIPPRSGEDPEYDAMQAHYQSMRYQTRKKSEVRRKCIDYILSKRKEKHERSIAPVSAPTTDPLPGVPENTTVQP
jgi:hypothetical protein